ncbi:MAG: DUF6746 family protein [Holosporales bacterium]
MKKHTALALVLALTAVAAPLSAANASEKAKAERAEHYEAQKPKTAADALSVLSSNLEPMRANLKAGELEKIHETSYTLEAALSVLNKDANTPARKAALKNIVGTVDVIHEGSEDGKKAEIEAALTKYAVELTAVQAAYK